MLLKNASIVGVPWVNFELVRMLELFPTQQDCSQHPTDQGDKLGKEVMSPGSGSAGRDTEVECKLVPTNRLTEIP